MNYQAEENSCVNMSVSVSTDGRAQLLCLMSPPTFCLNAVLSPCASLARKVMDSGSAVPVLAVQAREPRHLCKGPVGVVAPEA